MSDKRDAMSRMRGSKSDAELLRQQLEAAIARGDKYKGMYLAERQDALAEMTNALTAITRADAADALLREVLNNRWPGTVHLYTIDPPLMTRIRAHLDKQEKPCPTGGGTVEKVK